MTQAEQQIDERSIAAWSVKIGIAMGMGLVLLGIVGTILVGANERVREIATDALLVTFGLYLLLNVVWYSLRIIDWFEARKERHS